LRDQKVDAKNKTGRTDWLLLNPQTHLLRLIMCKKVMTA
jgi:hypothetical protein